MSFSHDDHCSRVKGTARSLKDKVSRVGAYVCTIEDYPSSSLRVTHDSLNPLAFLKTLSYIVESFNVVIRSEFMRLCNEMLSMKKRIEGFRETLTTVLKISNFEAMNKELKKTEDELLILTDSLIDFVVDSDPSYAVMNKLMKTRDSRYPLSKYEP